MSEELHGIQVTVTLPVLDGKEDFSEETKGHVLASALDCFGGIRIGKSFKGMNIMDDGHLNSVDLFQIKFNSNEESLPVIRQWTKDIAGIMGVGGLMLEYTPVYKTSPELIEV
jgi:hypothetical protein